MSEFEEHNWDYRVIHRSATDAGLELYAVHVVYFDKDGKVAMFDADPAFAAGDTPEELATDMSWMVAALGKPALEWADLPHDVPVSEAGGEAGV